MGRMRRILLVVALVAGLLAAWAGLVAVDLFHGWSRVPLAPPGDTRAFFEAAAARLDAENHGNAVLVLMEAGRVVGTHVQSVGEPVDADSLFQVASLSKWVTAWGVMTLVDRGTLDLDAPVSTYLTRWRLPESPYNDQVTVRRILSHTAGFTDGLGYAGFAPGAPVQSLEDSLTRAADASPGADGTVRVGRAPGETWLYSGGGYTLLQLIVEEVSGESFDAYMRRAVFSPLGMTGSAFVLDEARRGRVVPFHDAAGRRATHFTFTATAAASLYTSAADLTRFLQAQVAGANGEPPGRGVLTPETVHSMRLPEAHSLGFAIWGLGTILYAPNAAGGYIVGHDGSNEPAINTAARIDPDTGDGLIVLLTGARTLATEIGGEWVFWKVGEADLLTVQMNARGAVWRLAAGWVVILVAAVVLVRRRRRASMADDAIFGPGNAVRMGSRKGPTEPAESQHLVRRSINRVRRSRWL